MNRRAKMAGRGDSQEDPPPGRTTVCWMTACVRTYGAFFRSPTPVAPASPPSSLGVPRLPAASLLPVGFSRPGRHVVGQVVYPKQKGYLPLLVEKESTCLHLWARVAVVLKQKKSIDPFPSPGFFCLFTRAVLGYLTLCVCLDVRVCV